MIAIVLAIATAAVVPQQYAAGRSLPRIEVIDDSGRTQSIDKWKGSPAILVPMYTRCPLACPMITEGLKEAAAGAKANPTTYRVVLFSFDPRDTPADLRAYRERHRVPISWTMATAKTADVRRVLEALDVRVSDASGAIMHPNVAIALTPDLKTAKYLFGTSFSGNDLDAALDIARGGHDWIGRFGGYALGVLLLVCVLAGIYLGAVILSEPLTANR